MFLSCYYRRSVEKDFDMAVADLLRYVSSVKNVVRLVFFGSSSDIYEFISQRSIISDMLECEFHNHVPAYTYLSQPLLHGGTLGVEIQVAEDCDGAVWEYPIYDLFRCVKITHGNSRMLFLPGIYHTDVFSSVHEQSDSVMKTILGILSNEGFSVIDIVRQWNYIENITEKEASGSQRYQEFNDVRSQYYGNFFIENGYPAATGIGTQYGGVQIEVDVLSRSALYSHRIDNPSQRAAYVYSKDVLVGNNNVTTPKFERARSVSFNRNGWIYISGTAAIRGEVSLGDNAFLQTSIALDNIELLISESNLSTYGVLGKVKLNTFRVYVKESGYLEDIKKCIDSRFPDVDVIYVNADICRDNLLVEIEAYALIYI